MKPPKHMQECDHEFRWGRKFTHVGGWFRYGRCTKCNMNVKENVIAHE